MKKLVALATIIFTLHSCNSGDRGELVGTQGKKWHPEKPFGMTLVPGGSFIMGKSDDDFVAVNDAPTKTVTVRSFYMDETEITNAEYRQFVNWVRDSVVRHEIAKAAYEKIGEDISEDDPLWDFMPLYNRIDDGEEKTWS